MPAQLNLVFDVTSDPDNKFFQEVSQAKNVDIIKNEAKDLSTNCVLITFSLFWKIIYQTQVFAVQKVMSYKYFLMYTKFCKVEKKTYFEIFGLFVTTWMEVNSFVLH